MRKDIGKTTNNMKNINYTGRHEHSHNKGGLIGAIKGLQETKHFGAKPRARHNDAKKKALKKMRGESTDNF